MANSIREILEKKKQECKNRFNILDLCRTTATKENKEQCVNFEKCMQNKCKTCKSRKECEKEKGYVS